MTNEKKSKVAICERCNGYVMCCHLDYLSEDTEKEFTELTNEGFTVKIETLEETRSRALAWYKLCKNGTCFPLAK